MDGRKVFLTGLLFLLVFGSGWALAGDTKVVQVKVVIPEVLRLETEVEPLVFDLSRPEAGEVYPPVRFPAYYAPQGRAGLPPSRLLQYGPGLDAHDGYGFAS